MSLRIEVCVPNGEQYAAAVAALAPDPSFTVVRASVTCGTHACVAMAGNSFGLMKDIGGGAVDPVLNTHLSSYTPYQFVQRRVQDAIMEEHGGELPVGCAVVVSTMHPKHRVLIYAPTSREPGPLPPDSIGPYLAFRAALIRAAAFVRRREVAGVSVPLFGARRAGACPAINGLSVEAVCEQMLRANASLVQVPAFMRGGRARTQARDSFSYLHGPSAGDADEEAYGDGDGDATPPPAAKG